MAQLVIKRENVERQSTNKINETQISDWDSYLHSYWVKKMASSSLYDDAKTLHGHCKCCTRISPEVRKHK